MRDKVSENFQNNDSENTGNGARSSDKRGAARPLGNRFPKDPTLIAAIRKHEEEWQAILSSLSMSFGVSVNSIGNTLGR